MKVAIVIPVKNPGPIFQNVLDSVLRQCVHYSYEVLIIDSGSTDGTVEYVRGIINPKVRLHIIEPSEYGHGKTRNLGISMTSSEYVVLITHDALPANTGWLAAMVAAAEADPDIAGVFGRHLAYPTANPFTIEELERHFAGFTSDPVVWLRDTERYAQETGYRQYLHFFSDNNALVRRSAWEAHPYPDVDFAEDQIWAKNIIEAGYKKAYAHDACVFHSHDYSLIERLQRSFDESYAFNKLFSYTLCPNLVVAVRSAIGITIQNFLYARKQGLWRTRPLVVLRAPFENLMRTLGHYLGSHGSNLSPWLRQKLSWDHKLHAGLRKAQIQITKV
jgi:rhamnosyltransferase